MNTYPNRRHRYGDWRDMTVEELRDWLLLRVTSWWRHVTLMDLYDDDHRTPGGLHPQRGRTAGASDSESPTTVHRTALRQVA